MELLRRFKAGDVQAFESLFQQFQADVYRWIVLVVRDRGVAEDLTIETFWRVYNARQRFDPQKPFGAWARRIATNVAIDYMRSRPMERELPDDLPGLERTDPAWNGEIREKVTRAFRRLPPNLQAAATLALIEEVPYSEIAEALGKSAGAIRTRVSRAIRLLRKDLRKMGISDDANR
ncbi:MAG TPA: RNA polymerase sigma factor [Terriglobales bacterium]|nr:RNA polymerase sigma factor [Terriglobales bacterium]